MKRYQIIKIFIFLITGALVGVFVENSTEMLISIGVSYLFAFNGNKTIHDVLDLAIIIIAIIAFSLGEKTILNGVGIGFLFAWIDYKIRE
jgi:hypothetical protein